jgi:predicted hydrocarbon binding protein
MLSGLGVEFLVAEVSVQSDAEGQIQNPLGGRIVAASPELLLGLRQVLDSERPGSWALAQKSAGSAWGRSLGTQLDQRLAQMSKPALSELPLEACLVILEHHFASHGLGRLKLDLSHAAEHGVVIATLEHSPFADLMKELPGFADPLAAGVLQGFFEHISGQGLGCGEIECAAHGASRCTFLITAPERLDAVADMVGARPAEAIIARLCT